MNAVLGKDCTFTGGIWKKFSISWLLFLKYKGKSLTERERESRYKIVIIESEKVSFLEHWGRMTNLRFMAMNLKKVYQPESQFSGAWKEGNTENWSRKIKYSNCSFLFTLNDDWKCTGILIIHDNGLNCQ